MIFNPKKGLKAITFILGENNVPLHTVCTKKNPDLAKDMSGFAREQHTLNMKIII